MKEFIIGLILGGLFGILIMCLLIGGRNGKIK
jgi:hypothetical protein